MLQTDGSASPLHSAATDDVVEVVVVVGGSVTRTPQVPHMSGHERAIADPRTGSKHAVAPMMRHAGRSAHGLHVPHVAGQASWTDVPSRLSEQKDAMLAQSASSRTPLQTPGVRVVVLVAVVAVAVVVVVSVRVLVVVVVPVSLVVVVVVHRPHMIGQVRLIISPIVGLVQNEGGMLHNLTGSSRGALSHEKSVVVVVVVVVDVVVETVDVVAEVVVAVVVVVVDVSVRVVDDADVVVAVVEVTVMDVPVYVVEVAVAVVVVVVVVVAVVPVTVVSVVDERVVVDVFVEVAVVVVVLVYVFVVVVVRV